MATVNTIKLNIGGLEMDTTSTTLSKSGYFNAFYQDGQSHRMNRISLIDLGDYLNMFSII